jgi:hypothetical protein
MICFTFSGQIKPYQVTLRGFYVQMAQKLPDHLYGFVQCL